MKNKAFTLSELLITLSVLGLVAALTIPSIYSSVEAQRKKAVIKESLQILTQIVNEGAMTGELNSSSHGSYMMSKIQGVKKCSSSSAAQGCWDDASHDTCHGDEHQGGFLLANGASVVGFKNQGHATTSSFCLDWNGDAGNNDRYDDFLKFYYCYDEPCNKHSGVKTNAFPGTVYPEGPGDYSQLRKILR